MAYVMLLVGGVALMAYHGFDTHVMEWVLKHFAVISLLLIAAGLSDVRIEVHKIAKLCRPLQDKKKPKEKKEG